MRKAEAANAEAKARPAGRPWHGGWQAQTKGGRRPKERESSHSSASEGRAKSETREAIQELEERLVKRFSILMGPRKEAGEGEPRAEEHGRAKGDGEDREQGAQPTPAEAAALVQKVQAMCGKEHVCTKGLQEFAQKVKLESVWAKPGGTRLKEADIGKEKKQAALVKAQKRLAEAQEEDGRVSAQAKKMLEEAAKEVEKAREAVQQAQQELKEAEELKAQVVSSIAEEEAGQGAAGGKALAILPQLE